MLTNKGSITVRLDTELLQWLKNKADVNGSNISDVIRETILICKELEEVPDDMRFSNLLNTQAAKTTILILRLIENFMIAPKGDDIKLKNKCIKDAQDDFEKFRIKNNFLKKNT